MSDHAKQFSRQPVSRHLLASLSRTDLLLIPLPAKDLEENPPETNAVAYAFGCDQEWYDDHWQRRAGCGPCTSATILYYLAQTRPDCQTLYPLPQVDVDNFRRFMDQIWHYVTPGRMGVNEARMLVDGVIRFAATHQLQLQGHVFPVPGPTGQRRPFADFHHFIQAGLDQDSPVAFLNLSNGQLTNLDSWHWVTITALLQTDTGTVTGVISDSGEKKQVDLELWYATTCLGGSAVYFTPSN